MAIAPGLGVVLLIRPHVALIILIALTCAYILGRPPRVARFRSVSKVFGILLILVMASIVVPRAEHFLGIKNLSVSTVNKELSTVSQNTTNRGSQSYGTHSASTTPLKSPLSFPGALLTVLFRPLPFEAPTPVTFAASIESLFLLALTIASARRIVAALLQVRRKAYSAYTLVFLVLFVTTFASIGNFGILARERVQTLPAFFILLSAAPRPRRASSPGKYQVGGRRALAGPVVPR